MKGLNCLLTNVSNIKLIGEAMRNMADTILASKPAAKITVRDLYSRLKKHGVDIDLESAAYIYSDVFANDINQFDNFETDTEIAEYATTYPPVSAEVKQALMDAGYKKKTSSGVEILDWTQLMQKTEQEIKDEITEKGLGNEDDILRSLQNEWKQIISTALIKAKNDLSRRNEDISHSERTAIDKVADLHARGLFTDFKDDYQNAIHKAIGTSRETLDDLHQINELSKTARLLQLSGYGTNNFVGQQLQSQINSVINKARFRDAGWLYKATKIVSGIFELANLAILNNLGNRAQNFLSGHAGRNLSALQYGYANKEIRNLAKQTKRDVIRGGGVDFGEVSNMFNGDRTSTDAVREFLTKGITNQTYERAANWTFNQLMGVASLNGVDNYLKIKNTWTRFVQGMEDVLVSKGMTKQEAREKLNKELFGQKWSEARDIAKKTMEDIKNRGGVITINDQTIERFTADVVKAQLINNQLISQEELDGAWNAAYKTAGMEMGHVSNNLVTTQLNKLKEHQQEKIETALNKGQYNKAAYNVLVDLLSSKILFRFMGGGTNWIVLKLEKGGLGLVTGMGGRVANNADFKNKKHLSEMSGTEIEETITNIQKSNDKIARGAAGLMVNATLLTLAKAVLEGDDEDEELKSKLLNWMEKNRWSNKYVNNLVPFYLTAYLAWERQKKMGLKDISNFHRYSPIRSYAYNMINQQEEGKLEKLLEGAGKVFGDKPDEGLGKIGEVTGQFFNVDPIPYRPWKDAYTLYQGMAGNIKQTPMKSKSFWEGYLRFGITDYPKLEK